MSKIKEIKLASVFFIGVACIVGNLIYQAIFAKVPDYELAFSRSWFQIIALAILWISGTE